MLQEITLTKRGRPRQAGTIDPDSDKFIKETRLAAERNLFFFNQVFMGGNIMQPTPHGEFCSFLQDPMHKRKGLLAPRNHLKTTISKSLPLHLLIQPNHANIYFPDRMGSLSHTEGRSTRILFASKAVGLSQEKLLWIRTWTEQNRYLRAFWPHCFWEDPRRQSTTWNNDALLFPRRDFFDQATIMTVGVGGVVTGKHFNAHIHDDLIDEQDRYSAATMDRAYNWFLSSRSLFDGIDTAQEFILGTHWANNDIYVRMKDHGLGIFWRTYSAEIIDSHGIKRALWPEHISLEVLERHKLDLEAAGKGDLYALNYLNDPTHSSIVDFDISDIRTFHFEGSNLIYDDDDRDAALHHAYAAHESNTHDQWRGSRLNNETLSHFPNLRDMYLTAKD